MFLLRQISDEFPQPAARPTPGRLLKSVHPSSGAIAVFAVLAVVAGGCSSSEGPELAEVTGQITLDGQPVTNGIVRFLPDRDAGTSGPIASARLDENGKYTLLSPGNRPGAIVGSHLVTVICDVLPVREVSEGVFEETGEACLVPGRYASETTSGLRATVDEGPNSIDFELETE